MSRFRYVISALLFVALLSTVALSGGCTKDQPADETTGETTETPSADNGEEPSDDTAPPTVDPDANDGSSDEEPATTPETITVRLYWVSAGENALGVERTVPYTQAVATAAMGELLGGPTTAEKTTWPAISTAIPSGTKLLGVTVADGVAKVD
ncbi:MAG: GerMN domain-containing protein, partial [Actinomycetota bacterium]|nr:GerMN domain-containing protein [Actinomycetota bacterium]